MENREELISVELTNEAGVALPLLRGGGLYHTYATHKAFRAQIARSDETMLSKLPADGLYKVKIYNYGQAITLKNPIRIIRK